jgi:G3E family GTPase
VTLLVAVIVNDMNEVNIDPAWRYGVLVPE